MIDWITAKVPIVHPAPIYGGAVLAFDEDGVCKWKRDSFRQLEGSFESSAVCQTYYENNTQAHHQMLRTIWISGNPAKFLQGHNLFGPENLPALAPLFFQRVLEAAGVPVSELDVARWESGDYELDRVDVACMLDVGGPQEVRDCLSALAHQSTYINRGRGLVQAGTVSWGKRSGRNTVVKAYDKSAELQGGKRHGLPDAIPHRDALLDYAAGKVRLEVEFHSRALDKLGLRSGRHWHADTASLQWSYAMEKMNLSGQMPLTPDLLKVLPRKLQKTYMQWETGRDLRGWMTAATFKRHRKELLPYGIDIGQTYDAAVRPRVVSLQRVLQPIPAPAPTWARGTPLLAAA